MEQNKPRILYIATFPPPVHGSSTVSMQIKNSKLINEAFDGDYVNISTSRKMEEIGKGGIVAKIQKLFRFLCSLSKTFWLLLTHRYCLCYCAITINGSCFLRDAPFVLLCKMFGHKVVIHQHNKGMSNFIDRPVYRWLYPLVYKNVKVILLSWHLYPDIEKVVRKEDVLICPNGIKPTSTKKPEESLQDKENNKIPHVLFLSNLLVEKGVFVLLDALKILKEKGYSFVCDFVGGETKDINAQVLQKEVEDRGLNELVIYHGRKYGEEKEEYWEKADVFAFPTFNETFGLVNLEAMDHKLPVVSTNVGGIPDVVKDGKTGYIVPTQNPSALASAIEKLLVNPDLRIQIGKAGHKRFEEYFTEDVFERRMLECLKMCIGETR